MKTTLAILAVAALLGAAAFTIRQRDAAAEAEARRQPRYEWRLSDTAVVDAGMVLPTVYRLSHPLRGRVKIAFAAQVATDVGLTTDRDAKTFTDTLLPTPDFNSARERVTCRSTALEVTSECGASGEAYVFLQSQRGADAILTPTKIAHNRVRFEIFEWRCTENCS